MAMYLLLWAFSNSLEVGVTWSFGHLFNKQISTLFYVIDTAVSPGDTKLKSGGINYVSRYLQYNVKEAVKGVVLVLWSPFYHQYSLNYKTRLQSGVGRISSQEQ